MKAVNHGFYILDGNNAQHGSDVQRVGCRVQRRNGGKPADVDAVGDDTAFPLVGAQADLQFPCALEQGDDGVGLPVSRLAQRPEIADPGGLEIARYPVGFQNFLLPLPGVDAVFGHEKRLV